MKNDFVSAIKSIVDTVLYALTFCLRCYVCSGIGREDIQLRTAAEDSSAAAHATTDGLQASFKRIISDTNTETGASTANTSHPDPAPTTEPHCLPASTAEATISTTLGATLRYISATIQWHYERQYRTR